jgi:hypothetical protein
MLESCSKKLEIELFYGQMGYGKVSAVDSSNTVLTIKTSEWAPGIWAGAEKMPIEIRSSSGSVSRGTASIVNVSFENKQITLESAIPGIVTTVSSEDVIYHKGAYGNEFAGIHKILTQQSGVLFNIDVGSYNLFRGNSYSAGSAELSFPKLTSAAARATEKGHTGKMVALVNPRAWANMLNDQSSLRMYDQSYSKGVTENGSEKLVFHSQNGMIEIVSCICVKEGYSFLLAIDDWHRVGSSDLTFRLPGMSDDFLRQASDAAGLELRLWTDQALFTFSPGRNVVITDIVNS